MLNLDLSLVFIILFVWILFATLNKIFFKPVGEIIGEREAKIENETTKIESLILEIEEKTKFIENSLYEAKRESARKKEELIKEGEKVREEIVISARESSKDIFASKMKELDKKISNAQARLEGEIIVFSGKIKEIFF